MKHICAALLFLLTTFICQGQTNHVVISQVYGGAGTASAMYKNDYIELYNPTTSIVSLSGWSLQYASAGGNVWDGMSQKVLLTGSIAPGQYYLIAGASVQGINDLPVAPNESGTFNLSASTGKLALVSSSTSLSGTCPLPNASIVDMIGYGNSASCAEGTRTANLSPTTAAFRINNGCTDNNNNSTDFTIAAPNPRNTASAFHFCASASCAPSNAPSGLTLTSSQNSISGSFTPAAGGVVNPEGYIVLVSTASHLSELPADGMVYNVGDELGLAQVAAYGNSTSFTANNLMPGSQYHVFVYGYSASGCYKTNVQLSGQTITLMPPPCTPPSVQASQFSAGAVTSSTVNFSFQRGNGDAVLVVYRESSIPEEDPTNGTSYAVGNQVGFASFVGYTGTQNNVTVTGLKQNTSYTFAVYEYNTATNCYNLTELTGTATTSCGYPPPVTALNGTAGNNQVSLSWALPETTVQNGSCYDDILVLASTSPISADAATFSSAVPNAVYGGGVQLVYKGTGTSVTVTGLTNNTTYYFRAYSRRGTEYTPLAFTPQVFYTPFNPTSGYVYLYGNLHGHSSYSDGNKENLSKTPKDDYEYARDAQCMDFLGLSEHNHSGAGMVKSNYVLGYNQANQVNMVPGPGGNQLITLWGMEWGVSSSGGGHVLVYGFNDKLIGWESGNYDIFCAKGNYPALWSLVNNQPNAFAALAHPGFSDFGEIVDAYSQAADNAIYGMAIESGPALSNATNYNTYPSSLSHFEYYKAMLARGYRLAPQMDQDNHYMTFGTINRNRMVVMASEKSREALVDAVRNMRFYASNDCNSKVQFTLGSLPMGSSSTNTGKPAFNISITDPDAAETVASIEIWGGQVGVDSARLRKTFTGQASVSFSAADAENIQANNSTWYYFAVVTQGDGNKMVTAPIWYSRNDGALPVTLVDFRAAYRKTNNDVLLSWSTAQETDSREFVVERSVDGQSWVSIGSVKAAGTSNDLRRYQFIDQQPVPGKNLYRLRQVDQNLTFRYSKTNLVMVGQNDQFRIYPNPSGGRFTLNSVSGGKATMIVADVNGKELSRRTIKLTPNSPEAVDLSGYPNGIYHLTLVTGAGRTTERLTIVK